MKRRHGQFFTGNDISRAFIAARGHRSALRLHRRHFTFSHVRHTPMDEGEPEHKKGKHHDAQLLPGVDGRRIFGFPNSCITKIRYCDYLTLSGTAGAKVVNQFCANGIYDPDITNAGHQPLWRDNLNNIYDYYVVIGSRIVVMANPSTTGKNVLFGINCDDHSSGPSGITTLMEANNSVTTLLGSATGTKPQTLSATYEPLENLGISAKDDGASLTLFASNPSNAFYYNVWFAAADATSTVTVDLIVEIEYTVKCAKLFTQSQN